MEYKFEDLFADDIIKNYSDRLRAYYNHLSRDESLVNANPSAEALIQMIIIEDFMDLIVNNIDDQLRIMFENNERKSIIFKKYYAEHIKGNFTEIINIDEDVVDWSQVTIPVNMSVLNGLFEPLLNYFTKVRQLALSETLKMIGKLESTYLANNITMMKNLYKKYIDEKYYEKSSEDLNQLFEELSKPFNLENTYDQYVIIIEHFKELKLNLPALKYTLEMKIKNSDINDINFQRRYFMRALRNNKTLSKYKNYFNKVCNDYEILLKKYNNLLKKDTDEIKENYNKYVDDEEITEDTLIDELENY